MADTIQRYAQDDYDVMEPAENGGWVRFDDHLTTLASKEEEIQKARELIKPAKLRKRLAELTDKCIAQHETILRLSEAVNARENLQLQAVNERESANSQVERLKGLLREFRDFPIEHLASCNMCDEDDIGCSCGLTNCRARISEELK